MHAFETPGKARLRVRNPAGAVTIEATETGETTVELEALRDDEATREAIARSTVELSGGEVVVEIGTGMKGFGIGPAWISFGRTPQVGVESAARGLRRRHRDRLGGSHGPRQARRSRGEVRLRRPAPSRTSPTCASTRRAATSARASSTGEARLQTVSGDVRLGTVRRAMSVHARLGRPHAARRPTRTWR